VENKRFAVVNGKEEKKYDGIGENSIIFSPDSKRVAYAARVGKKWFVVVDRKEGKKYEVAGCLLFSSDSDIVAYIAGVGNKQLVVVNGKEGKKYDAILKGGGIIFDAPDSLHYLVLKDSDVYLVEERIK
jgi:hypothetical protein